MSTNAMKEVSNDNLDAGRAQDGGGYGKPPVHSRFKKGQSGNKKGRPRGRRSLAELAAGLFDMKIPVPMDGRKKMMPFLEALVHVHMFKALRGDAKSRRAMSVIMEELGYYDDKIEASERNGVLVLPARMAQSADQWFFEVQRGDQLKREREDKARFATRLDRQGKPQADG